MRLRHLLSVLGCVTLAACRPAEVEPEAAAAGAAGQRLVCMAPSITEICFALGLGELVVGVTDYCDYPPAALGKAKIGGYYDANYERIWRLKPSLVIILPEHQEACERLTSLGLAHLVVDTSNTDSIIAGIQQIGETCGATAAATALTQEMRARIAAVRNRAATAGQTPQKVLVCIGRGMGSGQIKDIYVAGPGSIYHELLNIAGAVNAYPGKLQYPILNAEGLLRIDPDVIIDMAPDLEDKPYNAEDVRREWLSLPELTAVRKQRVYAFTGDYVVVPGPRVVQLLEDLAAAVYPTLEE